MRRQQESLLEKIDAFEHTNRSLRDLLRGWSDNEVKGEEIHQVKHAQAQFRLFLDPQRESMLWFEEKDALMKRLEDYEAENIVSHHNLFYS